MFESILTYGRCLYLKQAVLLAFVALLVYLSASPAEPPNGGTWQGYTLGTISALLILFLLWFGIRKRQYHKTESSLAGWASAHVYLGLSLPVVASLHCGFQFDWNVHTLAYVLMILVVLSGCYGLYVYMVFPSALTANRNGTSRREMITAIAQLDETGLTLAEKLGEETHHRVLQEVVETRLGDTLSLQAITASGLVMFPLSTGKFVRIFNGSKLSSRFKDTHKPKDFLHRHLHKSQGTTEINQVVELLKVLNERRAMVSRVNRDIRYHNLMKYWLLLHIPLACALLVAVLVHVISVFFYW